MSIWRRMRAAALALTLLSAGITLPARGADSAGEAIYREGRLPSGAALIGERAAGLRLEGSAAACATCHRRSGLGSLEGNIVVPPIIGKYLFRLRSAIIEDMETPHVPGVLPSRDPYTDATLARAIRDGIAPDGHALDPVMPRYRLDQGAMTTLVSYLRDLTSAPVPGVDQHTLHFATIVTPDADPVARKATLEVLQRFFATQKELIAGDTPPMRSSRQIMYRVTRRWQLHVWELSGPAGDWERQLNEHLRAEPVFAVISGVGGSTWAPVHRFCERAALPCLFPNVDLPVDAESDFYSLYFSRGVLLEARLALNRIVSGADASGGRRIVQVYRKGDIGAEAAAALRRDAAALGFTTEDRALSAALSDSNATSSAALVQAVQQLQPGDELVLWLRPQDVAALPSPPDARVYLSGLMGGLEYAPLPAAWRPLTRMMYPFDLPEKRRVRMNFPYGWFKVEHIELTSERIQTDTYLACVILSETLGHMLDSFVRDFLIERLELMVSRRLVNGYYPRLGLAPGQRFASKGGYLVQFAGPQGQALRTDGEWTVP